MLNVPSNVRSIQQQDRQVQVHDRSSTRTATTPAVAAPGRWKITGKVTKKDEGHQGSWSVDNVVAELRERPDRQLYGEVQGTYRQLSGV